MKSSYNLKSNEKIYVVPISDLHIGSEQFNRDYFEFALEVFDKITQPRRIYLLGDLVEHASKTVGNSAFKTNLTLDDQIDEAIHYLKPFKKDIVFSCMGNHEARSSMDIDLNVNKIIATALHCKHGNQLLDTFKVNDKDFSIHVAHGRGSSKYAHTQQGKMIRDTQTIDADLCVQGHCHRLDFFSQPMRAKNGIKRKYFAFSGAYLNYNGYPDSMLLPVLPPAFQTITISKDIIVRNNPYYIDQVAPYLMEDFND